MIKTPDIHKSGGVLIRDRKFLVTRARGKDVFVGPGGKPEGDESAKETLIREMMEEVKVEVVEDDLEEIGTFTAEAAGNESKVVEMTVFLIRNAKGEPIPSSEIEEVMWINSQTTDVPIGSIFEHDVMPKLIEMNLID